MFEQRRCQRGTTREDKVPAVLRLDAANALDDVRSKALERAAFSLIALWHVAPRLIARSREYALVPLLWVQVFRYAPLALYAPGQIDPRIPADVAAAVGLGDLVSAVAALGGLIALPIGAQGAMRLVWVFSVVRVAELGFGPMEARAAEV